MNVSFREDAFTELVREAVVARLAQLVNGQATHANGDGRFSPAEWWVDAGQSVRHSLRTTAEVSVSGLDFHVVLYYVVVGV